VTAKRKDSGTITVEEMNHGRRRFAKRKDSGKVGPQEANHTGGRPVP
jgi:hypothetical protein